MKYSGMAFQIAAYIIVGLFLGKQLDKYLENDRPLFAALGAILFLIAFFIKLVNDLNKNKL
ncbi:MAG: AtpZ/AtpI family protein [Saprospiraceae bacterium]|nr:AtpZ/AtpI family protein [Saprospiraceae bacterium]